ncbi:hypothetical protein BD779DRAFT_1005036 [Infundibulicybe gibba]|nr:hypothetical protein BD779DRAFT_1005036 [Infundibulicybe gibba]
MQVPESPEMRRGSQVSLRFRESLHTIPTPMRGKRPQRFDPFIMRWPVVIGTPISMLLLGIALEIGVNISVRQDGFSVPQKNVLQIVSTQFLLSFFPTLFVIPVAFMWRELDWMMRWYQPYVLLANGGARAEESLLLNYIALGPFLSMFRALHYKHRVIFYSSMLATFTYMLQPLAGSIFQLRSLPQTTNSSVTNMNNVGLAPDVASLNAFVAAAGFAEASVLHNLPSPPFVWMNWTTAEFSFPPNPMLNGSMAVNTTGIGTDVHCDNSKDVPSIVVQGSNSSITSTSVDNCIHTVSLNISSSDQQYGVDDIVCGNVSSNVSLRPVMFWFFNNRTDGNPPEARTVFCAPTIRTAYVTVMANLNNGLLTNIVAGDGPAPPQNNLTSLAGLAYNGVIFPDDPNPFVQARANVIRSSVANAIFHSASQEVKGLQSVFDLPNGFLDKTHTIYTLHLGLSAQSIYFVQANNTLPAIMTSLVPRLWIDPFPAHLLAAILCVIGFVGIFIHLVNIRQRRKLILTAPPGSIAAVVSLTSKSGFGDLLLPYDDEKSLERKLHGLQFRMDSRTGAIVADDMTGESEMGPEDAMTALLGKQHQLAQSSQLAFEAAGGYPPRPRSPLRTPYDP